ncbi:phosphotransferase enzyme family protein [Rickettsia felis str. Pedreira]|uniref:Phosphotransferase enzyme family protein n=2 Tax=Rickettsia felis TaxID=42862 RepID=A0A0F3MV19_RICFI|nr:aminoglycoside phosphotransferase family protein [Rickettsia felis]AAY61625.1 Streptomycin 6-kinase [Rickettsia felis URRWXCal2]KJV59297.1 phosphotransferase enzyme family protein [Rickettsia felis str. Pedreira]MDE8610984.1 aminoglycoside phosphotransferase family protein [Rickettsia felis]
MDRFRNNIISIYKEQGEIWLEKLPEIISKLAQEWNLSNLKPIDNLSFNYVLSGYQNNKPIILKLSFTAKDLTNEAKALKVFSGFGAATILAQKDKALLLERAVPGISLKEYSSDNKIAIACSVMNKLHRAAIPEIHHFPNIKDQLKALDKEWDLPKTYLQKARKLRDELLQNTEPQILLHGDLHHENMLQNSKHWVVIDPKGVIGYPINEVCAFIIDIKKDTEFAANYFGFKLQEVRSWYFVQLMLAICWNLEDGIENELFLKLADKAYSLV